MLSRIKWVNNRHRHIFLKEKCLTFVRPTVYLKNGKQSEIYNQLVYAVSQVISKIVYGYCDHTYAL